MGKGMEIALVYQDDEISERVANFLQRRTFPCIEELQIDVDAGELTIRGRVASFYAKQVAMSTCQRVPGVLSIVDRILVD